MVELISFDELLRIDPEKLEMVEVVEYITINNIKSKKHGQTIRKVSLQEDFEWLEVDWNKLTDKDLEDLDFEAHKYPPEDLGMDYMLQLVARDYTVDTAKKKWRLVCKDIKTDIDLIKLIKYQIL